MYKWNNSNNHGHNADNYFWNLSENINAYNIQSTTWTTSLYRFKAKTVISLSTKETTQTTIFFRLTTRMFWQWMLRQKQPMQPFFHDNVNRFMYFLQQRHLQCFLFRIRLHNYVCLIIILTQEEEHSQRFRQLSVEVWIISYISSITTWIRRQFFTQT